ncbi:MAG: hypothetical protein K9G67_05805 [Bacteroidales bacterium]|nr:hypothetical protein [Bacteroidales bacterium]MCF8351034.1 hypothetical protein [Bacteroidales bacterium]MCF8375850.1 hypothetical protein [Bacteroidales bacterium]MCF8401717.1 hypothetical protein [Bacteroidales bacterium]
MRNAFLIFLVAIPLMSVGQTDFRSIHQEESEYYKSLGYMRTEQFDSLHGIKDLNIKAGKRSALQYRVFGYHPYWMGSAYLNYRWELLSDLCFFSYEVDPFTGDPYTTHDFLTAPVVDSAFANGTDVHLCVTLFSGHYVFFESPQAQQNLIDNLIYYVETREAQGINIDFEAVPYSLGEEFMLFLAALGEQFHQAMPEGVLSIAMPAVDWGGMFDIELMNEYIDLYMIMGYDYYWTGSSQAGPVAPLYGFTAAYDYCLSKTLSYYFSQGMDRQKLLLGLPYYARQWPTQDGSIPSNTTGDGAAYQYATIKNNSSGIYESPYRHWDPVSFSNYYAFESGSQWYQCFLEEAYGLGKRYDVVKQLGVNGVGIWALGYDEGYIELWDLINTKLCDHNTVGISDTLYDSGGPYRNYFNNERYCIYLRNDTLDALRLNFIEFALEDGYDTLWVFDGPDTASNLIGFYTGSDSPLSVASSGSEMTLYFKSDAGVTQSGWMAVCDESVSIVKQTSGLRNFELIENPVREKIRIRADLSEDIQAGISLWGLDGSMLFQKDVAFEAGQTEMNLPLPAHIPPGCCFLQVVAGEYTFVERILVL